MDLIMTVLIIIATLLALYLTITKLKKIIHSWKKSEDFRIQLLILNKYITFSDSEKAKWILNFKDKDDLIHQGQNHLWDASCRFHQKYKKLITNGMLISKDDLSIMEDFFEILHAVHVLYVIEAEDVNIDMLKSIN